MLGVAIKADNDQGDMLVDSTSIAVPERISVPVSVESAAQRQPPPAASLPAHIKAELEPRVAGQVDRLERLKRERASVEDYDGAFAIKNSLTTRVYPLLISFKECEQQMKSAAQEEDYAKAAKLKIDRDAKRSQAIQVGATVLAFPFPSPCGLTQYCLPRHLTSSRRSLRPVPWVRSSAISPLAPSRILP